MKTSDVVIPTVIFTFFAIMISIGLGCVAVDCYWTPARQFMRDFQNKSQNMTVSGHDQKYEYESLVDIKDSPRKEFEMDYKVNHRNWRSEFKILKVLSDQEHSIYNANEGNVEVSFTLVEEDVYHGAFTRPCHIRIIGKDTAVIYGSSKVNWMLVKLDPIWIYHTRLILRDKHFSSKIDSAEAGK